MPRIPKWKRRQWGKKGAEVVRLKKEGVPHKKARTTAQRRSREWIKKQYTAKQRKRLGIYEVVKVIDHQYLHMVAIEYPAKLQAQLWLVTYKDINVIDKAFKIIKEHGLDHLHWPVQTKTITEEKRRVSYYRIEEYIEGESYYVKKPYHYDMKKKVYRGKV